MKQDIENLKELFKTIKNKEFNESQRIGPTGLGYTFENLINKKEDNLSIPDYNSIEIKTKLGYTKSPLTLFCLTPTKENDRASKYLLENFGYYTKNKVHKSFRTDTYVNLTNIVGNKFITKLILDKEQNRLNLLILDLNLNILDNTINWDLNDIKTRLETKLTYLAFIIGYPYNKNKKTFYKYTNLKIYKLKDFSTFLTLLEKNIIYITFNIGYYTSGNKIGEIHDRGTAFRISHHNIDKLFTLIDKI